MQDVMRMLYELEEQAYRSVAERMRETLQGALDLYKSMRGSCGIALSRHHNSYGRGSHNQVCWWS